MQHLREITRADGRIPEGEFLVTYFLAKEQIRCDPEGRFLNGSNQAGVLFSSLEDADRFAREVASRGPRVGAAVSDSRWRPLAEYIHPEFRKQQDRAEAPGRMLLWATILVAAGSLFLYYEMRSGWTLIIGFLIGSRLLLSGIIKFARALHRVWQRSVPRP